MTKKRKKEWDVAKEAKQCIIDWFDNWSSTKVFPTDKALGHLTVRDYREIFHSLKPIIRQTQDKNLSQMCKSNTTGKYTENNQMFTTNHFISKCKRTNSSKISNR